MGSLCNPYLALRHIEGLRGKSEGFKVTVEASWFKIGPKGPGLWVSGPRLGPLGPRLEAQGPGLGGSGAVIWAFVALSGGS